MQRRNFIQKAALSAAVVSAGGLAGCAAKVEEKSPAGLPEGAAVSSLAAAPAGTFRGYIPQESPAVRVYRGIPFIKNPYEPVRRFLKPEPMEKLPGITDCFRPGSIPLQPGTPGKGPKMVGGDGPLTLNIWAPKDGTNHPVMVWVPGGGSIRCNPNDPRFDGTAFAEDGVVLVTIAYRVNVDGFLKLEGGDSNLGNRDIIAGLEWVKKNISAFGGDPAKIIAFGQSAGGTHLVDVIASPLAKGLLAGAIIQSPSAIAQWTNDRQADRAAKLVADAVGAEPTRESMMKVPFEDLAAFGPLAGKLAGDREWAQMTDGNTSLFKGWVDGDQMPMRPIEALRRGAAEGLHVIAGSMASEWRHYIVPNGQISKVNEKAVEKLLEGANLPKDLSRLYKDAGRGEKPGDRFAQIQSDIIFRMPALRLTEALAAGGAQVWSYSFDWQSPVKGKTGEPIGAAHSNDVPFVFKTLKAPRSVQSLEQNPPEALAGFIHGAWVRFAKTGNPGWARFDFHERKTMRFDAGSGEVSDPWAFERSVMPLPPVR